MLVTLPPDVPWFHGSLGIAGLRGLPRTQQDRGRFPREVAEGLFRLGEALAVRVEEGWLSEDEARREFQRTARELFRAYNFPDRWRPLLQESASRTRQELYRDWIRAFGVTETRPAESRAPAFGPAPD